MNALSSTLLNLNNSETIRPRAITVLVIMAGAI